MHSSRASEAMIAVRLPTTLRHFNYQKSNMVGETMPSISETRCWTCLAILELKENKIYNTGYVWGFCCCFSNKASLYILYFNMKVYIKRNKEKKSMLRTLNSWLGYIL